MEHTSRKRLDSFVLTNRVVLLSALGCITGLMLLVVGFHLVQPDDPMVPQPPLSSPPPADQTSLDSLYSHIAALERRQTLLEGKFNALNSAPHPALPRRAAAAPSAIPMRKMPLPMATPPPPPVLPSAREDLNIGIVVMTYNRPDYLARTLASLHAVVPSTGVKVYVSQDGEHAGMAAEAAKHAGVTHLVHRRPATIATPAGGAPVYYFIANHYKFAFEQLFDVHGHSFGVFVEDDMLFGADFFSFFSATLPLLLRDPTIWAVSSWNDNGQPQFVQDPKAILRADYFPGLGWGTSAGIWKELQPKWPLGFWDDWLRLPAQRKGRATLRPEVSRSGNFGVRGSSGGEFFSEHIGSIKVNNVPVDFAREPLDYLTKAPYDARLAAQVAAATTVAGLEVLPLVHGSTGGVYKMIYDSLKEYETYASAHGLMEDSKAGVARCAYKGVVSIKYRGNIMLFVPRSFS